MTRTPAKSAASTTTISQDKAILKSFRVKQSAPPGTPPSPPFQADDSLKWWRPLVKDQGYGAQLYQNALEFEKRKHQRAAAAATGQDEDQTDRMSIERNRDFGSLFSAIFEQNGTTSKMSVWLGNRA